MRGTEKGNDWKSSSVTSRVKHGKKSFTTRRQTKMYFGTCISVTCAGIHTKNVNMYNGYDYIPVVIFPSFLLRAKRSIILTCLSFSSQYLNMYVFDFSISNLSDTMFKPLSREA